MAVVYATLIIKFKFHCDSINIKSVIPKTHRFTIFKFHCDSINILPGKRINATANLFKFHCDSINISEQISAD